MRKGLARNQFLNTFSYYGQIAVAAPITSAHPPNKRPVSPLRPTPLLRLPIPGATAAGCSALLRLGSDEGRRAYDSLSTAVVSVRPQRPSASPRRLTLPYERRERPCDRTVEAARHKGLGGAHVLCCENIILTHPAGCILKPLARCIVDRILFEWECSVTLRLF